MSRQPLYPHIPGGRKPENIGTVWTAVAKLYDANQNLIATCIDTPNGIAKAFMELPAAMYVTEMYSKDLQPRAKYEGRMQTWNVAQSGLTILEKSVKISTAYEIEAQSFKYEVNYFGYPQPFTWEAHEVHIKGYPTRVIVYKTRSGWLVRDFKTGQTFGESKAGMGYRGFRTMDEAIKKLIKELGL